MVQLALIYVGQGLTYSHLRDAEYLQAKQAMVFWMLADVDWCKTVQRVDLAV